MGRPGWIEQPSRAWSRLRQGCRVWACHVVAAYPWKTQDTCAVADPPPNWRGELRCAALVTRWCRCCLRKTVVHQIGGTGSTTNQAPAYHPVVGIVHDLVRVRRSLHVAQA